ncbi:MAG TPA: MarR family transcriptional regulator [Longimicrobiales bacterium]|nr:MarR family transcriptional regulator [Longimicrobiales bacterium]
MEAGAKARRGWHGSKDPARAPALHLYVVLARVWNAVRQPSEADIAGRGFTPGEFAVLDVLYHRGPLLLGEVQRKVLVSSGGVTYLVDRLERQGLAERRDRATDRRARYAALTPKGEKLMEAIFPEHAVVIDRAVAGLDAAEQETAITLLRKLGTSVAP